jgi:hypothetical protein
MRSYALLFFQAAILPVATAADAKTSGSTDINFVSIAPTKGQGSSQIFRAVFRHSRGGDKITSAQILLTGDKPGAPSCSVRYQPGDNMLYLFNDAGTPVPGSGGGWLRPGSGFAANSYCQLKGAGSGVKVSGTDLRLTIELAFRTPFDGPKQIYLAANTGDGYGARSPSMGSWNVVGDANYPRALAFVSKNVHRPLEAFTAVFHDPNGAKNLEWVEVRIGMPGAQTGTCYIHFDVAKSHLGLSSDTGDNGVSSPGIVENNLCVVHTDIGSAEFGVNQLTLRVDMRFKSAFRGPKQVVIGALDRAGNFSGWAHVGMWDFGQGSVPVQRRDLDRRDSFVPRAESRMPQ